MCGAAVANRAMSLDGFIAALGHVIDWILEFAAPARRDNMAAADALLSGRRKSDAPRTADQQGSPWREYLGWGMFALMDR